MRLLTIGIFLALSLHSVKGVLCYLCADVERPGDCNIVGECPAHQKCHIKRYASTLGIVSYDVGCESDSFCNDLRRRDNTDKRQADIVMWNRCCDTDFCNIDYDEHGNQKNHTGLRCFDCKGVRDPDDCRYVIECETGDVCATFEQLSVQGFSDFRLTCEPRTVCEREGYFLPFGRRSAKRRDLCRGCCDSFSHCNKEFCSKKNHNTNVPAIGSTLPPTTTPKPHLELVQRPQNHEVEVGNSVILDCKVDGHPKPVISWEHIYLGVDTPVTHGVTTTARGSRLTITNVQERDAGEYICIASNIVKSVYAIANVTVGVPPHISALPDTQRVHTGGNITLPCQAKGNPPPTVRWDFHSATDDHKYPIGIEVTIDNSLVISSITQQHLGVWTCVAENSFGTVQANVTLINT